MFLSFSANALLGSRNFPDPYKTRSFQKQVIDPKRFLQLKRSLKVRLFFVLRSELKNFGITKNAAEHSRFSHVIGNGKRRFKTVFFFNLKCRHWMASSPLPPVNNSLYI